MRWIAGLGLVVVLPLLSGQGCGTPESPADRAYRVCVQEGIFTLDQFETLRRAVQTDYRRGFSHEEEVVSAMDGCRDGCGGYDWCLAPCSTCGMALVDAFFKPTGSTAAREIGTEAAEEPLILELLSDLGYE